MTPQQLIAALKIHPDAQRKSAEPDSVRFRGFCGLRYTAEGRVVVEFHCFIRTFADQAELEGWLRGVTPKSWQM